MFFTLWFALLGLMFAFISLGAFSGSSPWIGLLLFLGSLVFGGLAVLRIRAWRRRRRTGRKRKARSGGWAVIDFLEGDGDGSFCGGGDGCGGGE
jgi:hypothetical protein